MSPDDVLASSGEDGTIRLHDLARGSSRILTRPGPAYTLAWLGSRMLVFATTKLQVADVETGEIRRLDPTDAVGTVWTVDAHRVRFVDVETRRLLERDVRKGPARVIADNVDGADGHGELAIIYGPGAGGLRIVQGDVVTALDVDPRTPPILAAGPTGVAMGVRQEVTAWSLAGARTGQWHVPGLVQLFYGPRMLFGIGANNGAITYALPPGLSVQEVQRTEGFVTHRAFAAHGLATLASDGTVSLIDRTGAHILPNRKYGSRAIAGRPGGRRVAIGSADGLILWWDVSNFPEPRQLPTTGLAEIDAERIYSVQTGLFVTPRGPGETALVGHVEPPVVGISSPTTAGQILVDAGLDGPASALNLRAKTTVDLKGVSHASVDPFGGATAIVRDREVRELVGTEERIVWTAPENVIGLFVGGHRAAVALVGGDLVELDLATGVAVRRTPPRAVDKLAVDRSGTLWFAHGAELWREVAGQFVLVAVFPRAVEALFAAANDLGITLEIDNSVWFASPGLVVNRMPTGANRGKRFGERSLLLVEGNHLVTLLHLDTGERTVWRALGADAIALGERDRTVAIERPTAIIEVHVDPVPSDEQALRTWLAGVTNAVVDANGALSWR